MDRGGATGLAVLAAGAFGAYGIHLVAPALSPVPCALAIGALAANARVLSPGARAGCRSSSTRLLRLGVVLLGFRMPVGDVLALGGRGVLIVVAVVALTFLGTRRLARPLAVAPDLALLVASGFAICGASAIAAMNGVVDADEEEVGYAIGLVTLCGTLAIVVAPVIAAAIGLDAPSFGRWAGASVHDVGQVVATASTAGPEALRAAVVVKLTRVSMLAPVVVAVAIARRRSRGSHDGVADGAASPPPIVPTFVIGFLAAAALRSTGLVPAGWLVALRAGDTVSLTASMVGLGAGIDIARLRRVGVRPLALGLGAWALVGGSSLLLILCTEPG